MCILNKIFDFAVNGFSVWREACSGRFSRDSESIKKIKKELDGEYSGRRDDAARLREDKKKIYTDMRNAYTKIALNNG